MLTPQLLTLIADTDEALGIQPDNESARRARADREVELLTRWRLYGQEILDAHHRNERRLEDMTGHKMADRSEIGRRDS